ncbi:hypothetical protein CSPX01_02218 [Colletotrichum filicis]|nr:hypothetical protein CSPX01_02218 [Colletotrichum filicis]
MSTDTSDCPQDSNSTDCLLRRVVGILDETRKADDAKYDWDPLNFGVTVFIGAVALVFALIPIIQFVFTPGVGSRTSGRLAIGDWSKRTKRKWNLRRWTYEYTVVTPIFRMQILRNSIDAELEYEKVEGGYAHDPWDCFEESCQTVNVEQDTEKNPIVLKAILSSFLTKIASDSPFENRPPAATWIEFFRKTGLDDLKPKFQYPEPQNHLWEREVTADYLPSDLVAAPAYAQIGVIVIAIATHGWAKWPHDPSSKYPVIFGQGFQFDFRQHPILGTIGAYSRYGGKSQHRKDPDRTLGILLSQWLRSTTQIQEARLKTEKESRLRLDKMDEFRVANLHARGSVQADKQSLFRGSSWNSLKTLDLKSSHQSFTLSILLGLSKMEMDSGARESFMLDYGKLSHGQWMPIVALFLASTPRFVPALFPTDWLRETPPLTLLALSGHFWTNVSREVVRGDDMSGWIFSIEIFGWDQNIIRWVNEGMIDIHMAKSESLLTTFDKTKQSTYQLWNSTRRDGIKATVGIKVVLYLCFKLLYKADTFRSWFDELDPAVGAYLRRLIHLQLQLLDLWFMDDKHTATSTESRALLICNTTLALMLADEKAPKKDGSTSPVPDEPDQTVWHLHSHTLEWIEDLIHSINLTPETLNSTRSDWEPQRSFDLKRKSITSIGAKKDPPDEILVPLAAQMKPRDKDLKYLACANYNDKWELFNTHQMLDRLSKVASSRHDSSYQKQRWQQRDEGDVANKQTTDDMIIFRCILIALLFQTAPDNAALIKSGVWEQVVAIV